MKTILMNSPRMKRLMVTSKNYEMQDARNFEIGVNRLLMKAERSELMSTNEKLNSLRIISKFCSNAAVWIFRGHLILMVLSLVSINAISQTNRAYDLKWKIQSGAPIAYKTAMEPIDEDSLLKKNSDCANFITAFTDTSDFNCEDFRDFFEEISGIYDDYSFTTILAKNAKGTIDVKLISAKNDSKTNSQDSIADFFADVLTGVQLRGKINDDGGIESFYMKKKQMNLLALMFELPEKPVKIGDRWIIQANFISNDQNFICDDYKKTHIVELVDVKKIRGDLIASIKYDLRYYVNGEFNNPFLGNTVPTMMDLKFSGISEFNITKGKWKDYNGLMTVDVTGIMTNHTKQWFKLSEIENIPDDLLKLK